MRTTTRVAAAAALLLLLVALGASTGAGASGQGQRPARLLGVVRPSIIIPPLHTIGDGTPLTYHGGPVLHATTSYPVFWSPPGLPMPADYQAAITKYFQDLPRGAANPSTSYAVMRQYFDRTGPVGPISSFGAALVTQQPVPANECTNPPAPSIVITITTCVLESTVEDVIERAAHDAGLADKPGAIFFFFMPPGMGMCATPTAACTYHDFEAFHSTTSANDLLFALLPSFPQPQLGTISHEHIETLTDPTGLGWHTDESGSEIADLCQNAAEIVQTFGDATYTLPQEWSNADGGCTAQAPPPTTRLTLETAGKGVGHVDAVFSGQTLTCNTQRRFESCHTVARRGARVVLKAAPDEGFAFGGWSAVAPCRSKKHKSCTFTIGASETRATATFLAGGLDTFLVSVDVTGHGAVVWPNGTSCRASCIKSFASGTSLTLRAVPAPGWKLAKLSDDTHSCKSKPRCTIKLRDNDDVFAVLRPRVSLPGMERETRLASGGLPPLDRASIHPYDDGTPSPVYYQRDGHPVGVAAERLLGELEGGSTLLFPSGQAASTSVVLALLEPGATVALAEGAYWGTSGLLRGTLAKWGLQVVEFDQTGPPPAADLVWIEPCSNPFLTFPDIAATAEAAHAAGARLLVDNTALTPFLLRPLEHGADLVLHSATKGLAGHHDVLLGAVGCARAEDAATLLRTRTQTGIVAAPDPAWLLLRGLKTLAVRVERQCATALELARRLQEHPAVERVRYPGLGDPVAARYVERFGPLLSFDVADAETARKLETSLKVIENATSLGGVSSTLEARARWEPQRVPPGLLRLSAGLEDVEDLWRDLTQALQ